MKQGMEESDIEGLATQVAPSHASAFAKTQAKHWQGYVQAVRHQLEVLLRSKPRPRLRNADRILWVWLRRLWPNGWSRQLRIVKPETVIGWHRKGWCLYWTWRSSTLDLAGHA